MSVVLEWPPVLLTSQQFLTGLGEPSMGMHIYVPKPPKKPSDFVSRSKTVARIMRSPPNCKMIPMELTGNVRNRFVQAAVLLRMLDPVRGEATAHGLDQDSHEIITSRERLLKRKFLNSFALICAIKKDGDSTSAACMEEGGPQGTIIRIASNAGVGKKTLSEVRELVAVLNSVGDGGTPAAIAMTERHIA